MEPDDSRLICGHKDSGTFGLYLSSMNGETKPADHCRGNKFEQHPLRNRDGSLKK